MKKKFLRAASLFFALTLALTGCGGAGKPADNKEAAQVATPQVNKIVGYTQAEPATLDPAKAQGTHESYPIQHLFCGLTVEAEDGSTQLALADKIDVSDDGLKYTIKLKPDLKWSDGKPLTAADFEYSWKRVLNPKTNAYYAYNLYYIKGGEAYNTGKGSEDDVAVKAVDDTTLEVELEKPTAFFESLIGFYTYYPVQKELDMANPDWALDPKTFVSNGAFMLTDWQHNSKITMVKNPNFYNADKVSVEGLDFDVLEDMTTAYNRYAAGDYNMLVTVPPAVVGQLADEKSDELKIGKELGVYYYNLNTSVKPLNNVKVRQALSLAIDREVLTSNITKGGEMPATSIVPPGILDDQGKDFTEANKVIKTDVEQAKKLMEEGLKEEGMSKEDVNITILYNTEEKHKLIAQAIQQMWNQNLGIQVGLENVEFKVKLDREKAGDFQVSRAGWIGDYQDPMTFMDLWVTGGSFNDVKYSNPEYDKLIEEAKSTTDQKVRMDDMKKAEKMILDDMAIIPIYFYTQPYLVKPNVTGIYKPITNYPILTYAKVNLGK